jgi:hypothetical protein
MVASFSVEHAPQRPKSSFLHFRQEEKRLYNVEAVEDRRQVSMKHDEKSVVALSPENIFAGHKRPLAVEIDIPL